MTATETNTAAPADPHPGRGVVLFDGLCPLCQKSVAILKKLDWLDRLRFQDARDTRGWPPSEVPLDSKKLLDEMHVVPSGRDTAPAGFKAFRWIAWRLPLTWLLAPFLYIPGVPWIGTKIYRWVARNRFGLVPCKDGVCQVPLRNA